MTNTCGINPERIICSTAEMPLPWRNHVIHDHQVRFVSGGGRYRTGFGGLGSAYLMAQLPEHLGKQHGDHGLVLHDQDAERFHGPLRLGRVGGFDLNDFGGRGRSLSACSNFQVLESMVRISARRLKFFEDGAGAPPTK